MEKIKDLRLKLSRNRFQENSAAYDVKIGLVAADATKSSIHPTRKNVAFAHNVFSLRQEEFYDAARNILHRICNLQDKNPESYTYGLWPTSFEEKLCEVEFPDFNFADFISTSLIGILKTCKEFLSGTLIEEIKEALKLAAYCSMKRRVGLDYTNVICMSCFTITATGEILKNKEIFNFGKSELKRFLEYTKACNAFSEYNSPCYIMKPYIHKLTKIFNKINYPIILSPFLPIV